MDGFDPVNGSRTVVGPGPGLSREGVTVRQKKPMFASSLTALMKVTMLLLKLGGGGFGGGRFWVQDNTCTVLDPAM